MTQSRVGGKHHVNLQHYYINHKTNPFVFIVGISSLSWAGFIQKRKLYDPRRVTRSRTNIQGYFVAVSSFSIVEFNTTGKYSWIWA